MANRVTRFYISAMEIVIFCLSLLGACHAAGEFMVLHAPNHVNFLPEASPLPTSEIPDVIASTFGFQLQHDLEWNGLGQGNLFKRPKANVMVSVAGLPSGVLKNANVVKYSTLKDDPDINTESVVNRIESQVADKPLVVDFSVDSTVLDIRSHHPGLFNKLPATYDKMREVFLGNLHGWSPVQMGTLNFTQDADLFFMGELYIMKNIMTSVRSHPTASKSKSPDFFHFRLFGLEKLAKEYGLKSTQMRDAITLLQQVLDEVTQGFKDMYGNNVVIQVVGSEPMEDGKQDNMNIVSRKSRSLMQEPSPAPRTNNLNLTPNYTGMYPIAFNIILWTMIVMALTVFSVAWGMWFMDPGRDSIIYRMTSQRIKKD